MHAVQVYMDKDSRGERVLRCAPRLSCVHSHTSSCISSLCAQSHAIMHKQLHNVAHQHGPCNKRAPNSTL